MSTDLQTHSKPGWISKILWAFFVFAALGVGLYPLFYFFMDETMGLLSSKPESLLRSSVWYSGFYLHIGFGGLALLAGWSQFIKRIRDNRPTIHRTMGKVYVASVLISGFSAIGIGFFATGGWISASGFLGLGICWVCTTLLAFRNALKKDFSAHQKWMIYSYAACFAAVTLRIWLPLLTAAFNDFIIAYRLVAWISWVPNIALAHFILIPRALKKGEI